MRQSLNILLIMLGLFAGWSRLNADTVPIENLQYFAEKRAPQPLGFEAAQDKVGWVPATLDDLSFGFTSDIIWIQFEVSKRPHDAILAMGLPSMDHMDIRLFELTGSDAERHVSDSRLGDLRPFHERPVLTTDFAIRLPSGSSRIRVLARIQSTSVLIIPISVQSADDFYTEQLHRNNVNVVFFGMMLITLLYNFFIFLSTRYSAYLYYCLYIVASCTLTFTQKGVAFQYVWPQRPEITDFIQALSLASLVPTILLFAISFLNLPETSPRLFRFIRIWLVLQLMFSLVGMVLPHQIFLKLGTMSLVCAAIILFILSPYIFKQGRAGKFFIISWGCLCAGALVALGRLHGVLPHNQLTFNGQLIGIALEAALLSFALADRLNQLKNSLARSNLELKHINEDLERLVHEKTEDIRAVLDNIQVGVFTSSDENNLTMDSTSKHFEVIFGSGFKTSNIEASILAACDMEPDQKSLVASSLKTIIKGDPISFDLNSANLPREIRVRAKGVMRTIEMEWGIILNRDLTLIQKVIGVCRDVTDLRSIQEIAHIQSSSIAKIMELLRIDPAQFVRFYHSTENLLRESEKRLRVGSGFISHEILKYIKINLHTIKGNARSLGLMAISSLVHGAEQELGTAPTNSTLSLAHVQRLVDDIRKALNEYQQIFNETLNRQDYFRAKPAATELTPGYRDPIQLVDEIRSLCRRLSGELGKPMPVIVHEGFQGLSLSEACYEVLHDSFVHLIRNAMDHGIEDSEKRMAKGKNAAGSIFMKIERKGDFLSVRFWDDGQGLSLAELRRKGLQMKRLEADRHYSNLEIASLIFASGLSTASKASEISGRGIGIEAVQHFMESFGGSLEIDVQEEEGDFAPFAFIMTIPYQHFIMVA